jgi:hypothetical protein
MTEFRLRRRYTINTVIEEEDKTDQVEIEQAERAIVNHQYLKHMAESRIKARAEWKRLQQVAHGTNDTAPALNVRPMQVLEQARSKRQA